MRTRSKDKDYSRGIKNITKRDLLCETELERGSL
jgi:hypothetical protein